MSQCGVVDDAGDRLYAEMAFADTGVAVLACTEWIQAVVKMNGLQAANADDAIESFEYPVKVIDDVVAGIVDVAGIETNPHFFLKRHAIENALKLLEGPPDLAALASHRLEQDRRLQIRGQDRIQLRDNQRNAGILPLADVAAGMKIVEVAGNPFHALQVVQHGLERETPGVFVGRAGVERVGGMRQQRPEAIVGSQFQKRVDIRLVERLGTATTRVAREELKSVGADRQGITAHAEKTLGRGKVAANLEHQATPALCACWSAQ